MIFDDFYIAPFGHYNSIYPFIFRGAMFKVSNAYLIMYKTINNDIIRKICGRVYNTIFPFMKEAQSIQWNNFDIDTPYFRYAGVGVLRFSLLVCCNPVCVLFIVEAKQCLWRYPILRAVSRFHFLPFFFSYYFVYISHAILLFGAIYFYIYVNYIH